MGEKIKKFTDLKAWKEAHSLVLIVYEESKNFPADERFGITNQMRRSVISVTSNIAEGFGRNSAKDKAQFYAIAKGSALELQSQLYAATDLSYIDSLSKVKIDEQIDLVLRLISGLINSAMDK